MTDPNGWPDPQRPGVPMNPERDGAHMLRRKGTDRLRQFFWSAGTDWDAMTPVRAAYDFCYEGACLTPAEVAARVAEARREAMREAAGIAEHDAITEPDENGCQWVIRHGDPDIAAAILARAEGKP